jgi:hypothetical protein
MRPILSLASLLLGLVANAGCASAAAQPPAFELHGDDFDRVRGEYTLVDGHVAQLTGTRRHPRIEFDDGPSHPLRALSANEFSSDDGCMRVVFEAHANATVTRVRVTRQRGCEAR